MKEPRGSKRSSGLSMFTQDSWAGSSKGSKGKPGDRIEELLGSVVGIVAHFMWVGPRPLNLCGCHELDLIVLLARLAGLMGARVNRIIGLPAFYGLCWTNAFLVAGTSILVTANQYAPRSADPTHPGLERLTFPFVVALSSTTVLVGTLLFWRLLTSERRVADESTSAIANTRGRLRKRLDDMKVSMAALVPEQARAEIAIVSQEANVLWTQRGHEATDGALVLLTPSFWADEQSERERLAAFVHEAGHVAAGDVATFRRLWTCTQVLAPAAAALLLFNVVSVVIRGGLSRVPGYSNYLFAEAMGLLGLLVSWSALLCARELQADAFAADAMGEKASIRGFLVRRVKGREAEKLAPRHRLYRWLVQPDLAWRATLPALRGELGVRVEVGLSLGMVAAAVSGFWFAGLVSIFPGFDFAFWILNAGLLIVLAWLTFQFSWGLAHASRGNQSTAKWLLSMTRFGGVALLPLTLALGLAKVTVQTKAGLPIRDLVLVVGGFYAATLLAQTLGTVAEGLDARAGRERPSIPSFVVSALVHFGTLALLSIITVFTLPDPLNMYCGVALGVLACLLAASISRTLPPTRKAQ